jgi:hypothetical protein
MRIVQRIAIAALACAVAFQTAKAQRASTPPVQPIEQVTKKGPTTKEILTDAAIIAILIAASIAAYKASGRPCACPYDTTRTGRKCGGLSAWSKPGGAQPFCFPGDVTPGLIEDYRRTNVLPARLK